MYDIAILGGGPAGYLAAERAAQQDKRVLLIEERNIGGVCLNEGCIPSKSLLHAAKLFDYAKTASKYGVFFAQADLDFSRVIDRKDEVVRALVGGVKATLCSLGAEVLHAKGRIEEKTEAGFLVRAGKKSYEAENLIIATGSRPAMAPIEGLREQLKAGQVLTSREIFSLREIPQRFVVIGGGVIGLEMASVFCSAGSDVTVIEMLDKIAGPTEAEVSAILQREYEKKGVNFVLGARVAAVSKEGVTYAKGGEKTTVPADRVLLCVGRRGNVEDVGLEALGVYVNRGYIATDECMRTNIPGVYAAGDINGRAMLAHTAYREAEVAVNNICGQKDQMCYDAVPSVIYTNPEVAGVGETLQSARKKGIAAREAVVSMLYSGRYVAENADTAGIAKIVVDREATRLLGAHMIGNGASEVIASLAMAIERRMSPASLKKVVFPHPSISEIIKEAVFKL